MPVYSNKHYFKTVFIKKTKIKTISVYSSTKLQHEAGVLNGQLPER